MIPRMGRNTYSGVKLRGDVIRYRHRTYPSAGAVAMVESAGQVERRVSVLGALLFLPAALIWRKKKDHRELYLTVTGQGYQFVVGLDPDDGRKAREFAARLNTLGSRRQPAHSLANHGPVPIAATNTPAGWMADSSSPGLLRWWDGHQWTEHVRPA